MWDQNKDVKHRLMKTDKLQIAQACKDMADYRDRVLSPATRGLFRDLESNQVSLHQAYSVNMFAAHAMDYLHAIRKAKGEKISRADLLEKFDELSSLDGAVLANRKFQLVNLINNSLKHIELDKQRRENTAAIEHYGPIRFGALVEQDGRVHCVLDNYRFDFCRVVLRPVLEPFIESDFSTQSYVEDFAEGDICFAGDSSYDLDDPIDQMIEHCNPLCLNCGEGEADCECATFVFDSEGCHFEPFPSDPNFNFDAVMSQISSAR